MSDRRRRAAAFVADVLLNVFQRVEGGEEPEVEGPEGAFVPGRYDGVRHRHVAEPAEQKDRRRNHPPDVSVPLTLADGREPVDGASRVVSLTIGPNGKSEDVVLVTNPADYPLFKIYALLYRPVRDTGLSSRGTSAPAVHGKCLQIGGGCDLFPHDQGHPLTVFERYNTMHFRDYPICQRPNHLELTVWATGTPGETVMFRLNMLGHLNPEHGPVGECGPFAR